MIKTLNFEEPKWDISEICRYSGCKYENEAIKTLVDECICGAKLVLSYRICYTELEVIHEETKGVIRFGQISTSSQLIQKVLKNCDRLILFAATLGIGIDRLIYKYSRISQSKAVILQGIGAERIESLCDLFCEVMDKNIRINCNTSLIPRISPGYGDIPLEMQKDILSMLDSSRKIGVTLNSSLLMSPSKSVTALVGIRSGNIEKITQ